MANIFRASFTAATIAAVLTAPASAGDLTRDWFSEQGDFACLHCRMEAMRAAASAESDEELRYDASTGRDLRNYPPDRPADFTKMKLDIDVPDMNTPGFRAEQSLDFTAVGEPLDAITLNAEQMKIESVCVHDEAGTKATWSYDDSKLTVRFDPPIAPGKSGSLEINFAVTDPPEGLIWTPTSEQWPDRPPQFHTQGQPETNRYWFPCHDFPNERLQTEIVVTVPEGFVASSNGRLAGTSTEHGRSTFDWIQDRGHVNYLVSLVVGKFDVKNIAAPGSKLEMPVYAPPGKGRFIDQTFGRTSRMIATFEKRFDEPYPWDRYAQLIVWNFGAGGMENTSATTLYDTAILDDKALRDDDLDGLISHELGHQWFGDLITCKSWEHIWLNEGFATYCSALWYEERDGYEPGYLRSIYGSLRGVAANDQFSENDASYRPAMVSNVYKHPWETFRRTSNPYPKGASILHMLRKKLGDDLFFKGIATYVDRYKFGNAETDDFRRAMEEVSGLSLEHFFEQWAKRPGTPKLAVKGEWNEKRRELRLTVDQKQRIDADKPAFVFDLPIVIEQGAGADSTEAKPETIRRVIHVDGKRHELTLELTRAPSFVAVDPDLTVLSDLAMDVPTDWLVHQSRNGPTIASRFDAIKALGTRPGDRSTGTLRQIVLDNAVTWSERQRAADALGVLGASSVLLECLGGVTDEARVRVAIIRALGSTADSASFDALAPVASDADESYGCRAAALEALGKIESMLPATDQPSRAAPILVAALGAESQHDQVRIGAIRALATINRKESLDAIIPFTRLGTPGRTRPVAIEAVGRLAHHDKDKAFAAVAPLLSDREQRSRDSAGPALVEIEDKRGLEAIDRCIAASRDVAQKERAQEWRATLAARLDRTSTLESTKADVDKLKRELDRLKKRVEDRDKQ